MKKIFFIILLAISAPLFSQEMYYYYANNKVVLRQDDNMYCMKLNVDENIQSTIEELETFGSIEPILGDTYGFVYLHMNPSVGSKDLISYCEKNPNIETYSPILYGKNTTVPIGCIGEIILQLDKNGLSEALEELIENNNYTVLKESEMTKNQLILKSNNKNVISDFALSNALYETGLCEYAEPNFLYKDLFTAVDSYYQEQWGLKNTGQHSGYLPGADINIEAAWNYTTGNSNIIVAVVDEGVELNHPDLRNRLVQGYDATNNGTAGGPLYNSEKHGTACAGIIGAERNNTIGVSGVAPGCRLMPIHATFGSCCTDEWLANGIRYAANNGASVISNSWGGGLESNTMNSAINYALTQGRNNKGCVVVFAAGNNYNNEISYPSSHSGVIAVGAMMPNGTRCNFSNYGTGLSVVAPGKYIATTDRQGNLGYNVSTSSDELADKDYTKQFSGTSAACPYVAGVAALLLSYNPDLSASEVKKMIERSARKINENTPYLYFDFSTLNHPAWNNFAPNGTWNSEMGYGLVDAYQALKLVETLHPIADLYIKDNVEDMGNEPNYTTTTWSNSPSIWITAWENPLPRPIFDNGVTPILSLSTVSNPECGKKYKIWVRVNNMSNLPSPAGATVDLRWTIASNSLFWNSSWYNAGTLCGHPKSGSIGTITLPSIPAYGSTSACIVWTAPSFDGQVNGSGVGPICVAMPGASWRFALSAIVNDGNETPGIGLANLSMDMFTSNSNNVAWRNYTLLNPEIAVATTRGIFNPFEDPIPIDMKIKPKKKIDGDVIIENADIFLTLSDELMAAWRHGGGKGEGIVVDGTNTIRLTSPEARLNNIIVEAGADYPYTIKVAYKNQFKNEEPLEMDMVQICHKKECPDSVMGVLPFYFDFFVREEIEVIAKESQTILSGEEAHLWAESDAAIADYTWLNSVGDTIGDGETLDVSATESQRYFLLGYSEEKDALAFDSVVVTVRRAIITALSPNPANGQTVVNYRLAENVTNVSVVIANAAGQVLYNAPLNVRQTTHAVNLQSIPSGQYTVRLESQGTILDSKSLLVY